MADNGPVGRGRLEGRHIVVVGAGAQVFPGAEEKMSNGRAMALLAAREGAAVACVDIDAAAAQATADMIAEEGGTAHVVQADVGDPADCERLVAESRAALGAIDGLVLNVGVIGPLSLAMTDAEAWDRIQRLNLRSHFLVARSALPVLEDDASVVFSGSVAGLRPGSFQPAYDAAKAGQMALQRHVAQEGSFRRIRANSVVFGLVDTPLGAATSANLPIRVEIPIPLGRQGTAWDMASSVIFLLSDEASYITGQALVVDGGLTVLAPLPRTADA